MNMTRQEKTDRELFAQALEALKLAKPDLSAFWALKVDAAITALRERLARQEQEPFGCVTVRRLSQRHENHTDQYQFYPAGQPPYLDNVDECHTVYTAPPPAREWQGLTLEDMDDVAVTKEWLAGARWAEAKLKDRNDA